MSENDGLQTERTALAWRRTGLALLVAALLLARLNLDQAGPIAVSATGVGAALVLWALVDTFRRGRMARVSAVDERFPSVLRDARLPAAMSVTVIILAVVELLVIFGLL